MNAREFNGFLKNINDERSLEHLYKHYYGKIILYLTPHYGRVLAEDCAQEFFINLLKTASKQEYIRSPTAWVYKCCANIAKYKVKYDSRYVNVAETDATGKCDLTINDEVFGDLYSAMHGLDELSKKVIYLYYWLGYNQREIAEMLNQRPATIRKIHGKTIKKIRALSQK